MIRIWSEGLHCTRLWKCCITNQARIAATMTRVSLYWRGKFIWNFRSYGRKWILTILL